MGRRKKANKEKYDMELVRNMPPMHHTQPGQKYAHEKSDVLKWIAMQYEFLNMLFNDMKNCGYVKYDPDTQKWQGVDYENEN